VNFELVVCASAGFRRVVHLRSPPEEVALVVYVVDLLSAPDDVFVRAEPCLGGV